MERRTIIKSLGFGTIAMTGQGLHIPFIDTLKDRKRKVALTVAHITDVHIRSGDNAPNRFKACLKLILDKYKPDFFLNGGDAINDASYDNVTREQVIKQWEIWDDCITLLRDYEIYSCIGNHDTWWKAPSTQDAMYGKPYVVQRLQMLNRYYSFDRKNWHFVILDGNNPNISLDDEQFIWLKRDLEQVPPDQWILIMGHYPILGTTQVLVGGGHSDSKRLKDLFYQHRHNIRICLSGHNHLSDKTIYNGVQYCCNGAMSGFWWGNGDHESAEKGYYMETPPGFAILKLYDDGTVDNTYYAHEF